MVKCMKLYEKFRPDNWDTDKYGNPLNISSVIGQQDIVISLKEMVEKSKINSNCRPPDLLFIGQRGIGKNTVAQIFARQYLGEGWLSHFHEFNASDSRKLGDIREVIKPLSKLKVKQIINLTEADGMTGNTESSQDALRRIMETAVNTVFILDVNDESKIIDPIKSRCAEFRFHPLSEEAVIRRLVAICEAEKVNLDDKGNFILSLPVEQGLSQIYKISHGDMRKAINELEKIITAKKEINAQTVLELSKTINLVYDALKTALAGDFEKAKNLIEDSYILSGQNTDIILDALTDGIGQLPQNDEVKIRLFYELGELEHRLSLTHRAIIPLTAFVSFAYVAPHLRRN